MKFRKGDRFTVKSYEEVVRQHPDLKWNKEFFAMFSGEEMLLKEIANGMAFFIVVTSDVKFYHCWSTGGTYNMYVRTDKKNEISVLRPLNPFGIDSNIFTL